MITPRTTLCSYGVLQRVRKLTCHKLAVVSMQRALRESNSPAFRKQKLESLGNWCNGKGIPLAYFRYDSNI